MHVSEKYLAEVIEMHKTEHAREHAYRPALKEFFSTMSGLTVVNDPKRSEHGAPDFVFLKSKMVIAYAEAKDIGVSLDKTSDSEQLERYYGYSNLILTNNLEFRFYRNGQPYSSPIRIGEINKDGISAIPDNFILLEDTLKQFLEQAREPITSGSILAKVMAGKARRIRDNIKRFLKSPDETQNKDLISVYKAIKDLLLADLNYEKFADMYAQTLVYGLFVARYSDNVADVFTRQKARDLVPASNPFLRHFFDHIAGASFDSRLEYIVNELCEEFTHTDVRAIVHNYYNTEKDPSRDPIIHFYEDFLTEYNPQERMQLGVFYTPVPVVHFIVRSLDEILHKEFGLKGLADDIKIDVVRELQNKKLKEKVHKVQLLDPATGTGTFLNETILHIKKSFAGQEGRWAKYVKEELLPRLHGFELMMAPYTIAHLKIASTLKESGADAKQTGRIGIYLTNSLEKAETKQKDLFSFGLGEAITQESVEAGKVKNDLPIMVVLGNPPYSGESMNPGYTANDVYKFEPGTGQKLQERNSKWLNDDYVKFLRFAESLIEKTGEGVVGMITAHGYLDNPTFRGMRYHLMETFDSLYVLDLHGNANKKEIAPNGGPDKNVFDIKQGVAILLAVKKSSKKKKLAEVFRYDIQGSREEKYGFLENNNVATISWQKVQTTAPKYEFVARDSKIQEEYFKGFSINDLFVVSSIGIVTSRDDFVIDEDKNKLARRIKEFLTSETPAETLEKFGLRTTDKWKPAQALKHTFDENNIRPISYRPFDDRFIYYNDDFIERSRKEVMRQFLDGKNVALLAKRQSKQDFSYIFVSNKITESCVFESAYANNSVYPLYVYEKDGIGFPNFKKEIYKQIIAGFKSEIKPENILNYVYAVLHSQNYRERFKEFLKIDFPRIPYPKNEKKFFELSELGQELQELHLLESPKFTKPITTYPASGNDIIEKVEFKNDRVYINKTQYFGDVPKEAWEFFIGGYQPAQKWLKDRKGQSLSASDIKHYQQIIVTLFETVRVMNEIDTLIST